MGLAWQPWGGLLPFDTVQASWNLLEPSVKTIFQQALAGGMGVIVKEVLASGRLTSRNLEPKFTNKYKKLRYLAAKKECTPKVVAVAAAFTRPWAEIVLSGAVTPAQLDSSLQATQLVLSEKKNRRAWCYSRAVSDILEQAKCA